MPAGSDLVPLPLCSQQLGLTWRRTYDLVLAGKLQGEQRDGRWMVRRDALDRLLRERKRMKSAEAASGA